jgi:hypothetical protein
MKPPFPSSNYPSFAYSKTTQIQSCLVFTWHIHRVQRFEYFKAKSEYTSMEQISEFLSAPRTQTRKLIY